MSDNKYFANASRTLNIKPSGPNIKIFDSMHNIVQNIKENEGTQMIGTLNRNSMVNSSITKDDIKQQSDHSKFQIHVLSQQPIIDAVYKNLDDTTLTSRYEYSPDHHAKSLLDQLLTQTNQQILAEEIELMATMHEQSLSNTSSQLFKLKDKALQLNVQYHDTCRTVVDSKIDMLTKPNQLKIDNQQFI